MTNYLPPLSIMFIWHPSDEIIIKPIVEHCTSLLSNDIKKPFSRAMNLPTFHLTTLDKGVPSKIKVLSDKTIIFVFISEEVVADDEWVNYVEELPNLQNVHVIPIAMANTAFNIRGALNKKNFIRAYEFNKVYLNEYLFISITHEIYRWALNDSFKELDLGKNNALKLFLSHAKDKGNGVKLAQMLKQFIDNSSMRNFFDATDIAIAYKFDEEIIRHIKESSIIAIHSDDYSSRYWCQLEILYAKEYNRPIVAVDTLEEYEDRRFPFASNIPGVHVHLESEPTEQDLLRILSSVLLETVRFFYSKLLLEQYKKAGWIKADAEILSRPPEVSDIKKLLTKDGGHISLKHKSLVYPEPPLYSEEVAFLREIGMQLSTPLTIDMSSLRGKNIGISISDISNEELIRIGQSASHLTRLSQDMARYLLTRGATLLYGGDIRKNGFAEFIFNEAHVLQSRLKNENIYINNYIAWPLYKNDTNDIKHWKGKHRPIAKMIDIAPPDDIKDLILSEETFLPPINTQNLFVWSRCLTEMRNKMIVRFDIRICAGGKHCGYKGIMPGVLEEIIIAIKMNRPIFLLGGFGGVTASVCKLIQNGITPKELTLDWQIDNNAGYKEVLDFYLTRNGTYPIDYSLLAKELKIESLNNGLIESDNYKLFTTPFIEEAIHLVLKGLNSIN